MNISKGNSADAVALIELVRSVDPNSFEGRIVIGIFVLQAVLFLYIVSAGLAAVRSANRRAGAWPAIAKDLTAGQWVSVKSVREKGLGKAEVSDVFLLKFGNGKVSKLPGDLKVSSTPVELEPLDGPLNGKEYLALLPALGLLGTFLGIALALSSANMQPGLPVEDMQRSIAQVIHSTQVVFLCAIGGLFFLLLGQWVFSIFGGWAHRVRLRARADFEDLVVFQSPLSSLSQINFDVFRGSAEQLQTSGKSMSDIVTKLGETAESLGRSALAMEVSAQTMAQTMQEHIKPFGAKLGEFSDTATAFTKAVGELRESNRSVSQSSTELAKTVGQLSQSLNNGLEKSAQRMEESLVRMSTVTQDAASSFKTAWEGSVGKSVDALGQLSDNLKVLSDSLSDTNEKMSGSAKSLQTGMDVVRQGFEASMTSMAKSLRSQLETAVREFETSMKVVDVRAQSLDVSTAKSLELLEKTQRVTKQMDEAIVGLTKGLRQMEASASQVSTRQQELVGRFFDEAGTAVAELTVQLGQARRAMEEAAHAAQAAQTAKRS
jgi:DNA anti-recombination protein RmuC